MKEVKYIPGDLIKSDRNSNLIWEIEEVIPNEHWKALYITSSVDDNISSMNLYEHRVVPIPLTSEILEKNGWMEATYLGEVIYCLELTDFMDLFLQFNSNTQEFAVGSITEDLIGNKNKAYFPQKIKYIHQLQHLLFGLGLDSSLKV